MQDLEPIFLSLFEQSRHSDVVEKAKELNVAPGSYPTASKILAASLFSLGEHSQANDILSQLESVFGNDLDFLILFASNCRRLGFFRDAQRLFEKGLALTDTPPPQLLNNYANLLIDLSRYDEARKHLNQAISLLPDYADAHKNLKRLNDIKSSAMTGILDSKGEADLNFSDPLLLSFTDEEVLYSDQRYFDNKPQRSDSFLSNLPSPSSSGIAYEKIDAAFKANSNGQYELALKICSSAFSVIGPNGRLFDCISDAYISLKKFAYAEICILQAISFDSYTPSRCFNLVSLSLMRGDMLTAKYYFDKLSELDPSHSQLDRLRDSIAKHSANTSSAFNFANNWPEPAIAIKT